ncbi:MAG TPA: radical SAM protein [Syntrophomonas sp.]|nr:radical SAM protein [Syntrophomonas sp.]
MDKNIAQIINKALDGGEINAQELRQLFAVHYLSEESFMIQYASRKICEAACAGKAEVHGQMGINVGSCPRNCQFCSFAEVNNSFPEAKENPLDDIIANCLKFEADGANAIYLMITATYKFSDFIKAGKAVKAALKTDVPLISNVGDFNEEVAKELKDAGFTGIYHAIRLGEGTVTAIDPKLRWRTINAAKNAGLLIGTCLEPVGPEHTLDELVEKTLFTREMKAVYSGAGRRITIPTSSLAVHGMSNYAQMGHILAAVKLATGYEMVGNCTHEPNHIGALAGANLLWAEIGSNPRDTEADTVRGWTVERCQDVFKETGWDILEGPSVMYREK